MVDTKKQRVIQFTLNEGGFWINLRPYEIYVNDQDINENILAGITHHKVHAVMLEDGTIYDLHPIRLSDTKKTPMPADFTPSYTGLKGETVKEVFNVERS